MAKKFKSPVADFSREVQIVIIASFFVALGFGIVFPAIPVFVKSFGVNNTAVGLVVSAFAIARFSSGMISGRLVDRFGERNVYSFGVLMVSFFTVLVGLAQNYPQLLAFRAAGGLGSSMFSVASSSLIFRAVDDAHRARALSVFQGSFLVGGISGPAIGGALATISLRAPFFAYAFMLAIAGLIGYIYLGRAEAAREKSKVKAQDPVTFKEAMQIPAYRIALVLSFIFGWAFYGMRSSILPIFVTESLNSTAAVVGYGFAIGALVQGLLLISAGRASDKRGRKFVVLVGGSIFMAGIMGLTFSVSVWMFLLSMAILGVGGAYLSTAPGAIVGDVIKGKGGRVIGIFQMSGDAGMIVGPIVVGAISDLYSYRAAFAATALVFTLVLILGAKLPETRKMAGSHEPTISLNDN
ncbi:MAG: MFS transporter [Candidatus Nanopelagicaceae bacterium]|nr:MFS transporter [Candidatus Nanopelagicaceae bacterium]